jgi:hypothetical protein
MYDARPIEVVDKANPQSNMHAWVYIQPHSGKLSVNASAENFWTPEQFIELAQSMIRAAKASEGIRDSWIKQQEAKKRADDEFNKTMHRGLRGA